MSSQKVGNFWFLFALSLSRFMTTKDRLRVDILLKICLHFSNKVHTQATVKGI